MADENDGNEDAEATDPQGPLSLVKAAEKNYKTNKILMIIVLSVCGLMMTIMGTGLAVMFVEVTELQAAMSAESNPEDSQYIAVEEQLMLLADFRKSELKKISEYTQQLKQVSIDCSIEKAEPYQQLLSQREKDFQQLVVTVKKSANDLAGMSRGSKEWLKNHNKILDGLSEVSQQRKKSFDQLMVGAKP